jgi:hypothetical protein
MKKTMQQKYFVKECVKKERRKKGKKYKDKNILTGWEKREKETV